MNTGPRDKPKIVSIVGTRPQFVKAAVLSRLIRGEYSRSLSEYLVHTGQHYDHNMSKIFFEQMQIPHPDINLEIGSGGHGKQTGEMLVRVETVLERQCPEAVIVYGDTNSTLAGALAASKMNIPVVHVEAGLRSYDRSMPEEQNRIVADHLGSILFCPTKTAAENLRNEGITDRTWVVGDVMYDASLFYRNLIEHGEAVPSISVDLPNGFYLLTLHRAENTDNLERLTSIVEALNSLTEFPGVFPIHPRTRRALSQHGLAFESHIRVIEPVGFLEMLELERSCRFVVTDSGGVQKETFFFAKPCITLRDQTEWVETVSSGWNVLVGADRERICTAFRDVSVPDRHPVFYGDGAAGVRMLEILSSQLSQ